MVISPHWLRFQDYSGNPLIEPPDHSWLIGDPTVLPPDETPDSRWHLFANSQTAIHHYVSPDGYAWEKRGGRLFGGIRACVRREGSRFHLLYERLVSPRVRVVAARESDDLVHWSEPRTLLTPDLAWEGRLLPVTGNPCLLSGPFGYRIYYSAGNVFLWDTLVVEPRCIGVAEADALLGPYRKRPQPLLLPSPATPYRNLGAGAIKVFRDDTGFVGLNNGIYKDVEGLSRSAILLLHSEDGLDWRPVCPEPLLAPKGSGWKRAFVYALDVVQYGSELRLYYNARDGWRRGRERIGVAVTKVAADG